ncbi:hypothetical protein EYC84_006562 [Monilinia fructicola]|uniref:Uncharacterized protein n=1 Tax=Monilinia fructicola TaxID=38448 RepID=A0A5M9K4B1_MONFR|nr:hypothetical protein EYC84_006562 [Monilinia fructicola]
MRAGMISTLRRSCHQILLYIRTRERNKKKTLIVLGIYTRIVPSFLPAVNQTPYTPNAEYHLKRVSSTSNSSFIYPKQRTKYPE